MTQQLNIRFPDESDILRRLKAISYKTGLTHRALIEKWLEAEESGTNTDVVPPETANLVAEVSKLAERVARLESMADAAQSSSTPDDNDHDIADAIQQHSNTANADTRIMELKAEGFSLAQIAETLTSEGIPTPGGAKEWNKQTISNRIAKLQKQRAVDV